jgi:endonuclease G
MITSKNDSNITFSQDNNYRPVAKPKYYYKALAKKVGNVYYTIAYKINNVTPSENDFNKYKLTVNELETETGFIFFPNIPASAKNTINNSIWQ